MQCPLCQATDLDTGFFCSQECFAKNFVAHRDAVHASGVVKEKAPKKRRREAEAEAEAAAAEAEALAAIEAEVAARRTTFKEWPMLPGADETGAPFVVGKSAAKLMVTPALKMDSWVRLDVAAASEDNNTSLFSSALFAAQFAFDCNAAEGAAGKFAAGTVIVCGSATSCHVVAWAARCRRIPCVVISSVSHDDVSTSPQAQLDDTRASAAQQQVVIVSAAVLRGKKKGSSASLWTSKKTLVAMPDVANAEDLQSVDGRVVFVHKPSVAAALDDEDDEAPASQKKGSKKAAPKKAAKAAASAVPALKALVLEADGSFEFDGLPVIANRFNNELSTLLCGKGDLAGAVALIANMHTTSKTVSEEVLFNTLLLDWGAASSRLHHHKLAYLLRALCDIANKIEKANKNLTTGLCHVVARCIVRAAKHVQPIDGAGATAASEVYLQATLCYCYPHLTKAFVDDLAQCWGLTPVGVVGGVHKLRTFERLRAEGTHKVRTAYKPRLGDDVCEFLLTVHQFLADCTKKKVMTVAEVGAALMWDELLAAQCGTLINFLIACHLLNKETLSKSVVAQEGAKKIGRKSAAALAHGFTMASFVQPPLKAKYDKLPRMVLPLLQAGRRKLDLMTSAALDEILMAMPPKCMPMYIGEVGNLIGVWTKFNSKFGGKLGVTLSTFLEAQTGHFKVIGNVVTRLQESKTAQIKIRHDVQNEDDSDDEREKAKRREQKASKHKKKTPGTDKKRAGLQMAERTIRDNKNMPGRSKTKKIKSLRNKARHGKNVRTVDAQQKVKGYTKPSAKKLTGRGRKVNMRAINSTA
jgi:hypothetical protein